MLKHEDVPNLDILISLVGRERTRVAKQIDKANSDATIDIQNQLIKGISISMCFYPSPGENTTLTVSFFVVVTFSTANA